MSDDDPTTTIPARTGADGNGDGNGARVVPFPKQQYPRRGLLRRRRPPKRVRIRKLRVIMLLLGLGVLALVSTVFGMLMAVASELPPLEAPLQQNSEIVDIHGHPIGTLTGNERRIYLTDQQIAPVMEHAIIAIEDRRFYTNNGVDLRGIARAAIADLTNKQAVQGASTIPQQFVKLQLAAENKRTVFEKVREAALAYHLSRQWSKQRILRNYLNAIYFGNGAYGIESAARIYFSYNHSNCGGRGQPMCASELLPPGGRAAGRDGRPPPAAMTRSATPWRRKSRRNLVLLRMCQQGFLTRAQYEDARATALPTGGDLTFPTEQLEVPVLHVVGQAAGGRRAGGGQQGAQLAFGGGLTVKTTIDSRLQQAAQDAIKAGCPTRPGRTPRWWRSTTPTARSGRWSAATTTLYNSSPFNLATQGQRQPGSSFKPFVLAEALRRGISPYSTWTSAKHTYILKGGERFTVNNFDNEYAGARTLAAATTFSDNSVFVQVGMKVGTKQDRPAGPADGHPHAGVAQRGDRARRPAPGRHAARHGARLRDDRRGRQADLRHALPRLRPARAAGARARRDRQITQRKNGKDKPVKVDGRTLDNRVRQQRVLTPTSPARSTRSCRPWSSTAPAPRRRSPASSSRARPARPRTTATPGSWPGPSSTRSPSGSAIRTSSSRCAPSTAAGR